MKSLGSELVSNRLSGVEFPGVRKILQLAEAIPNTISFALGEPDFDTPENIKKAAIDAIREGFTKYTSNYGILELRQSIAKKLKRENNIDVDPRSEILVTVGVQEALYAAFQALLNPGDEVIISDPCYHSYPRMIKLAGGKPVYVKLTDNFSYDIAEIEKRITSKTKILLLNSPQNPTGKVVSRRELESLAALAEGHNIFIISDEIYEKIVYDVTHVSIASLPGMLDRTLTVNGFSKAYAMTGWRLGYCVARKTIIDKIVRVHAYSVTSANSVAQKAGVEALEGPQESVNKMVSEFKRRRDYLVTRLSEIRDLNFFSPQGAFYVFPDFSNFHKRSWELAEYLLQKSGIITVPGIEYGPSRDSYLRMSFAISMTKIEEGLNRLENALNGLRLQ
ncbi:MAG: pyridoxal phosphate-dependent aminotransferase [Conexivisphaerales archaeon]